MTGTTLKPQDAKLVESGLNSLSPRWTTAILIQLSGGTRRTTHLMRSLPGLSAKTLTERLRKLQKLGLVTRETFREVPPRVEYTLTAEGEEVVVLLAQIKEVCPKWADPQLVIEPQTYLNIEVRNQADLPSSNMAG